MAKVRKNIVMEGLSGSLGRDHYIRITRDGRTIISVKPDFSNRQFSEEQLCHQSRMKQASAYARVASKENHIYAKLAEGKAKNAYNIALGDWFNAPVIRSIDVIHDGIIRVSAHDDVKVTGVTVTVLDEAGHALERGEARLEMGVWWDYQPISKGCLVVEARDLPGNVTRQEFCPSRFNTL